MDGRDEDVSFVGEAAAVCQVDSSCPRLRGVCDDVRLSPCRPLGHL